VTLAARILIALVVPWVAAACARGPATSGAPSLDRADAVEVDASKSDGAGDAPAPTQRAAPSASASWVDAPGDAPADVAADTEAACVSASDGRTGKWTQIVFQTKTWRELAWRVDHGKGGRGEIDGRMRAQCKARHDSKCCKK
jgi:hypothetical protein